MRHLYDKDGRLRHFIEVDPWALYVALVETDERGLLKVGVTMDPARRARDMEAKGPHVLARFKWAWVGGKGVAHRLEAYIHRGFAKRRLPGEWFAFDFRSAEDKRCFNATVQQAYEALVERPLLWNSVDLIEMRAERAARSRVGRPPVRRLDFRSRSSRPEEP